MTTADPRLQTVENRRLCSINVFEFKFALENGLATTTAVLGKRFPFRLLNFPELLLLSRGGAFHALVFPGSVLLSRGSIFRIYLISFPESSCFLEEALSIVLFSRVSIAFSRKHFPHFLIFPS